MSDSESSDDEVPLLVSFDQSARNREATSSPQEDLKAEDSALPPVPVMILSGFLGSGKTTLIQYILRSPDHGKKIAVIENEFSGAASANTGLLAENEGLNIESLIARDGSNDDNLIDLIELPNGCICCTVKDSLVETLEALIEKKRDLDYIMIECSGMANPGPIASIFWLDDALESRLRLDGIITCVDSRNIDMQLVETSSQQNSIHVLGGDEAAQQIAYADRIIVNKIDLLPKEESIKGGSNKRLDEVVAKIRAINSTAPIRTTTFSQVQNLSWILDTNCFDVGKAKDLEGFFEKKINECINKNCASCVVGIDPVKNAQFCLPVTPTPFTHTHTNSITTIALIESGSICLKKLNLWLANILWPDQDKDDSILTKELKELERIGKITTTEIIERRRRETIEKKMLIFRVKGIISSFHQDFEDLDDGDEEHLDSNGLDRRKYIVQAVNDLWDIKPTSSQYWDLEEKRICKLVLIGRNLNSNGLSAGFKECFI